MITIKKNPETVGKLKVGTTGATPADGEIVAGNVSVGGATSANASADGNDLVCGSTTGAATGASIVSTNAGVGSLFFTDGAGYKNQGQIKYDHDTNAMTVVTNTADALTINSSGLTTAKSLLVADGANDVALTLGNSSYGLALDYSTGDLSLKTNGTNKVTVNNAGVCTFSGGINLGDTTLSNYAEGTWTPILKKSTTVIVDASTGTSVGIYTRVGDMLYLSGRVLRAAETTEADASNRWNITGLPFSVESSAAAAFSSLTVGYNVMNGTDAAEAGNSSRFQANSSTTLELYGVNNTTAWASGTIDFTFSGVLKIA